MMNESKRKSLNTLTDQSERVKGRKKAKYSCLLSFILPKNEREIKMKTKINLTLVAFLLGGGVSVLPTILKLALFIGAFTVLFMNFDDHFYKFNKGECE
ncbi:TPA: hypothetical protein IUV54_003050 [Enterococcus faecalis]|uniref:hypothetical protein n=3 Tax=Enterococcus faecalis TaxID=1351 RepID=UPI00032F0FE0|nr:hypothetical protein [Enterococcus faecalis]EOJ89069.1 hypothetical protein WOG_02729 [Enterococcus faecalis EnGen0370]EOK47669.1 hypothetical protein Q95_00345 [Enterococcus faecalis EnGen0062]EKZ0076290.1 hypothetical protein [Enterococcus faecalis]MBJ0351035.1 hypothetical protein [Enterococcus faecalis]MBJ0750241.1 hypothetical protein [Enterococcus faecalis]